MPSPNLLAPIDHDRRTERLSFTGSGAEYFRIWIANTLLSIVTLGIYSAWAKVRKERYFYGHTHLAGTSFDYHGRPIPILKGRLLAAALFVLYGVATQTSPKLLVAVVVAYLAIVPWIVVKALQFRARVSSWRGIRFAFDGSFGESYFVFGLLTVCLPLTLGLIAPYWWFRRHRFSFHNLRFGQTRCTFSALPGQYYRAFLTLVVIGLAIALAAVFLVAVVVMVTFVEVEDPGEATAQGLLFVGVGYATGIVGGSMINGLARGLLGNLSLGKTSVGPHALSTRFDPGSLAWIQLVNTVLIVLTLGLYIPFAQIRLAKYLISNTALEVDGDLDSFVANESNSVSATGGEIADVFDIDVGW
ncbi:MAG: DUF898 domain-containing protein [Planctomycetes bacterium]|nr:DUF898 domain-containing protein [Planctomycetota bacterium]